MIEFSKKLFPIYRSLTGAGVRKTLLIIKKEIPNLKINYFKSGKKVFDWKVPPEWSVKDAYIKNEKGKKIVDFKKNNLSLVVYSQPMNKFINAEKLKKHIFTIPNKPNWIPYITSYYKKFWGFCMSENDKKKFLRGKKFKVNISSTFNSKGKMNYGELYIKGKSKKEILFSTYICHPQLANNEISGPTLTTYLAKYFKRKKNNYSMRFLFLPETIGSIAYIHKNLERLKKNVIAGYVLTCVGDEGNFSLIPSKKSDSISNNIAKKVFQKNNIKYKKYSFLDRGSDERQFNSPGVDLPIASITRTKYGSYSEYHTSADNFNVVTNKGLLRSFTVMKKIIDEIQNLKIPTPNIFCEPFLRKRKLYPDFSTIKGVKHNSKLSKGIRDLYSQSLLDFYMYCNGLRDIDNIALSINVSKQRALSCYEILKKNKIIY